MIEIYYQGLPTPTMAPADMLKYYIKHNAYLIVKDSKVIYKRSK